MSTTVFREGTPHVLVVHDEPEQTEALSRAFGEMGLDVEIAVDAGEAVRCILGHFPDLVCINLSLPRGSGYELCELIRGDRSFAGVPIVVMSDRHFPEDIAYAEEAGANVFMRLPSPSKSLDSLARRLAPLFEGREPPSGPDVRSLQPGPI